MAKRSNRIHRDVSGKRQKRCAHDAKGDSLHSLATLGVDIAVQPPQRDTAGRDLDHTVNAEADQRNAACQSAEDHRDETFERVVTDGDQRQLLTTTHQRRPLIFPSLSLDNSAHDSAAWSVMITMELPGSISELPGEWRVIFSFPPSCHGASA